ncbi:hypothetical protein BC830DRAFT_1085838 [Chytriomyces sp. MP71]|nr:hypothetical protein BC830DRAFT_1085838 [Chytriomyces sp. MP71]
MALDASRKPLIHFDASLKLKEGPYSVDEDGHLVLDCAPFESYKQGKESVVPLPNKKTGPPHIGFYKEIGGNKVKILCPFGIQEQTKKKCEYQAELIADISKRGLELDKKNYPLIEALKGNYAGLVTLDKYETELAKLLKGTINLKLTHQASTMTTGFVTYKARWGPKYHRDTEKGLYALYSKLLDRFNSLIGPIDELSGLVTVPCTFCPITCNRMMWVWQRSDVDKGRDNDVQDGAHFSQLSNQFANNDARETIENMLIDISETHEPSCLLPVG